ncbi:MAG TPA: patatin-like phospholipase family protein [Desulfosporosinus sp.]|nr:patatin-like phospholipase family protein [Desulfosporosinus sp.]
MTFDGGGVKGALTVVLLRRLQQIFPQLLDTTDFFAGTSTGSFIALGLAYGIGTEQLVNLYSEENAKFIFTPPHFEVFQPKYDHSHLKEVLLRVFPEGMRLAELIKHRVLVPSFAVNAPMEGFWYPVFNNNFPNSLTQNEKVIDIALSSSAAPFYFPAYNHQIDGAVFANNPSPAAIVLAVDTELGQQNLGDIVLLSLGTGLNPSSSLPILSSIYDEVVESASYLSSQLLEDRYFRLNPTLSTSVGLDEYEKIPQLIELAESVDLEPVVSWIQDYWF